MVENKDTAPTIDGASRRTLLSMASSIRKNWIITICLVILGIFLVNAAAKLWHTLFVMQTNNQFKWIGLALHNYHDTHGSFPPVVLRDDNGNPIHSWRSLLQEEMAKSVENKDRIDFYDFSQSWDSETNQQSTLNHQFGNYTYQVLAVVGPSAAWLADGTRSISDFKDGTSNSILFIAVRNSGVSWLEPVDAMVSESGLLTVNNQELDLSTDLYVVTADGSVRCLGNDFPADVLAALLTINSGDEVGDW